MCDGCWMPCFTTRVFCVFHYMWMPQGSAPSPGPDLHHLLKWGARGLAVLWDKFHRKTLKSSPFKFSFGSAAQQSQHHTALTSVLPWLPSDPSGWLHAPGRSVAPEKHLLSHVLFMESPCLQQSSASSSELKPPNCAIAHPCCFSLRALARFARREMKQPHDDFAQKNSLIIS